MSINHTKIYYNFKKLTTDHITEDYISWLNNPIINEFLQDKNKIQTKKTVSDFIQSFDGLEEKYIWGIYHKDKMVGTTTLSFFNKTENSAEIGLMIGDTNYWGKLASDSAFKFVLNFAFNTLEKDSVTGTCYDTNIGIIFTFKKLGFVRERLRYINDTPMHQWRITSEKNRLLSC